MKLFTKLIQRLAHVCIATFIFFFVLEITLQVISLAYNVKLNKQLVASQADNNRRIHILCVGDSYTQGVGASDMSNSYPLQLERYLNANSSRGWKVVNSGVASTNSSELVHYLPRLFSLHSFDYLCVLIGLNDGWNFHLRDKPFSAESSRLVKNEKQLIPWKLCFRTARLFKMLVKYFKETKKADISLFHKDRKGMKSGDEGIPYGHGEKKLSNNTPQATHGVFAKSDFRTGEDIKEQLRLARSLISEKRVEEALKIGLSVREKLKDVPTILHVDLAWLFENIEELQYALDEIEQIKRYYPEDPAIYELLGDMKMRQFDYDAAEFYCKKTISMAPQRPVAYGTLALVNILRDKDFKAALKLLIQAYILGMSPTAMKFYFTMAAVHAPVSEEYFFKLMEQYKKELGFAPAIHEKIAVIYMEASRRINPQRVLKRNLSEIRALCLQYKIKPIFITYPMPIEVNKTIREFAAENNEAIIDSQAVFDDLLKESRPERYFVPDMHLNDEGYKILGEQVGDFIIKNDTKGNH